MKSLRNLVGAQLPEIRHDFIETKLWSKLNAEGKFFGASLDLFLFLSFFSGDGKYLIILTEKGILLTS